MVLSASSLAILSLLPHLQVSHSFSRENLTTMTTTNVALVDVVLHLDTTESIVKIPSAVEVIVTENGL
jgi:hypothetical protein